MLSAARISFSMNLSALALLAKPAATMLKSFMAQKQCLSLGEPLLSIRGFVAVDYRTLEAMNHVVVVSE